MAVRPRISAQAGSLCRDAMHECDMPDYCSGAAATCAEDVFKADGTEWRGTT